MDVKEVLGHTEKKIPTQPVIVASVPDFSGTIMPWISIASFVGCKVRSYISMSSHPLIHLWMQMLDQSICVERLHYMCPQSCMR